MVKGNIGGRQKFKRGDKVRYLMINGRISDDIYLIDPETTEDHEKNQDEYVRSDRKGHIILKKQNENYKYAKDTKVHFRRIMPIELDGKAPVIGLNDKYRAICPTCGCVKEILPGEDELICSEICGKFTLFWLGAMPMNNVKETTVEKKKPTAEKKQVVKPEKPARVAQEPVRVDFEAIRKLRGCQLWTKKTVKFDHVEIDVQAHALLFVEGDAPRKLCFNTYDGSLGKKSPPIPIAHFIADTDVPDSKKAKLWFPIKDLAKATIRLGKEGYELQK